MFSNNLFHEQLHLMHYINIISSSKTNTNEIHSEPIALFYILDFTYKRNENIDTGK